MGTQDKAVQDSRGQKRIEVSEVIRVVDRQREAVTDLASIRNRVLLPVLLRSLPASAIALLN